MSKIILRPKHAAETRSEVFDFTSRLALGETISSASTGCAVYSGTDASPSSVVSGPASISGAQVTQLITGGTLGVTYLLTCTALTSAGQTLGLEGFLVVTPPGA